jgi:hypothetical protein
MMGCMPDIGHCHSVCTLCSWLISLSLAWQEKAVKALSYVVSWLSFMPNELVSQCFAQWKMKGENRTLNRHRRDRMICQPHSWTRYTVLWLSMFFMLRVVYWIAGYALLRVFHRIKPRFGISWNWDLRPPLPLSVATPPPTPVPGSDGGWNDDQTCWRYQLTVWIVKWYLGGEGGVEFEQ